MAQEGFIARDADLKIRRMRAERDDYELLVRWRNEPHVAEWWDTDDEPAPVTFQRVVDHYGPRMDPEGSTTSCIIELGDRPVGYLQFYRWDDYAEEMRDTGVATGPDTYGLDILIGEPDVVGVGVGSRAVALTCAYLFDQRGANTVALLTAVDNLRAHRAYERAGMRKVEQVLDTDVRDGERVLSWLMVIERPGPS